ncbi:MAG TPA: hypothetical protein VFW44_18070 [Bryobacteraceae bacterium]|nr:hypothetical protein [Bryobacteraceae bacterium]
MDPTLQAVLGVCMRWIHIVSVVALVGGFIYARFVFAPAIAATSPEESNKLVARGQAAFRPIVFVLVVTILISGIYNYATKTSYPPGYHMWMGIKLLLVLHILSSAILDVVRAPDPAKSKRTAFGIAITGVLAIAIADYLRYLSLR